MRLPEGIFTLALYGFIVFAAILQALWFTGLAPGEDLLAWSNYGQLAAALFCAALSAYLFVRRREGVYVISAFAFGGWFLSNTFWYLNVVLIDRSLAYPSVGDAGFLGFMLLAIAAIGLANVKKEPRVKVIVPIYALFLLPGIAGLWLSPTFTSVVTLAYYLCFAATMAAVVQHYDAKDRLFFAGVLLYCFTMLIYVSREVYFADSIVFTLVGQLAIVSFCVMQLGLLNRAGCRLQPGLLRRSGPGRDD